MPVHPSHPASGHSSRENPQGFGENTAEKKEESGKGTSPGAFHVLKDALEDLLESAGTFSLSSQTILRSPCLVFLAVQKGQLKTETDKETFRKDVLCLCSSSPILLHPAGPCTVTVCFLRQSRLAALFPECSLYSPAGKEGFPVSFSWSDFSPGEQDRIRDILSELSSTASCRKSAPQKSGALLALLGLLPDSFFRPALPPPKGQLSPRQEELYHALYSYMVSHCEEGLKQPQAARLFSITPQ